MNQITLALGFGLVTASILALTSVGLTLQFGVTNYVNFAYGGFLVLGAYIAWQCTSVFGLNLWVAAFIAMVTVGCVAVLISKLILEHFAKGARNLFYLLIVTFGLALIIQNAIEAIWGPDYVQYSLPPSPPLHLGVFLLSPRQLIIIGIAVVAMLVIHALLAYTKLGKAMRAMSDNNSLAMVSGINTGRVTTITWLLSGLLAGLGGAVYGYNLNNITPTSDLVILFVIFAAVILGGIGKPYGAMIGALVVGIATELSAVVVTASYKEDIAFVILVAVLLIRPSGIISTPGKA